MYIFQYIGDFMAVINPTYARNNLFTILDEIENGEKYIIESKGKETVMINKEEYDSLVETLYLLSDPNMAVDINDAKNTSTSEMVTWHA